MFYDYLCLCPDNIDDRGLRAASLQKSDYKLHNGYSASFAAFLTTQAYSRVRNTYDEDG